MNLSRVASRVRSAHQRGLSVRSSFFVCAVTLLANDACGADPAPQDIVIDVEVVDQDGQPCGGIPVSIVEGLPEGDDYLQTARTDLATGVARLTRAAGDFDPERRYAVRLGIPHRPYRQSEILPDHSRTMKFRLVLPPTGRVELEIAGRGVASAGILPALTEGLWEWQFPDADPRRTDSHSGRAIFPWVQCGLEYEYAVVGPYCNIPQFARFLGPKTTGETLRVKVADFDGYPIVTGRLVDEESDLLGDRTIHVNWHSVSTDASGRFLDILERGESRLIAVDVRQYVTPPAPGDYRVRIYYHNDIWIGEYPTAGGWVASRSDFVTVRWTR